MWWAGGIFLSYINTKNDALLDIIAGLEVISRTKSIRIKYKDKKKLCFENDFLDEVY